MVRPRRSPAFLTLHFAPGECAQVDWGSAGTIRVGTTRRALSFFVMVLCYSRRSYLEFTLSQSQEQWLACHEHAFEYFGGLLPPDIMVDYVSWHIIHLLCPTELCGREPRCQWEDSALSAA